MSAARRKPLIGAAITALIVVPAASAHAITPSADEADHGDTIHVEYFPDPQGSGRVAEVPSSSPVLRDRVRRAAPAADVRVQTIKQTGPSSARLDVTIIGDGYTASEQDDFLADAREKWQELTEVEPYRSYRGLFNVWAVEAVSHDHGVSGDPTPDVVRDTALGAHFWCGDIERLVCVDLDKTASYAANAPATDLVIVLANSEKYGGAGYSGLADRYPFNGVSTLSSDNAQSSLIGTHEVGHSVGLLADEYTYDTYGTYEGAEPAAANATIYTADQLLERQTKWYRWLGEEDPSGGTVGTVEGNVYYPMGIYRPTEDSIMRRLGNHHFNLPGQEAMVDGFYRYADAITAVTPTHQPVHRKDTVSINPAPLAAGLSDLQIRWYVDGREAKPARGKTSVVPQRLGVPSDGQHLLRATVVDRTQAVRDPAVRQDTSNEITWQVVR